MDLEMFLQLLSDVVRVRAGRRYLRAGSFKRALPKVPHLVT